MYVNYINAHLKNVTTQSSGDVYYAGQFRLKNYQSYASKDQQGIKGKVAQVIYTNLQNSTFDGQKIDKVVFTYSDLQPQTGDDDNVMWHSITPELTFGSGSMGWFCIQLVS